MADKLYSGNGKGDAWRKTDLKTYRSNYEAIFNNRRGKCNRRARVLLAQEKGRTVGS